MRCGEETDRSKFIASGYVSRNASEPSQASLRNFAVVSLLELVKPETYREATTKSSGTAARSKMGWRA
jgi:hypothetical protein